MKMCSRCKENKDVKEFFVSRSSRAKDGLHNVCRSCSREYGRQWYLKNKSEKDGLVLKSKFGITNDDYLTMLKEQKNCCAICGVHNDEVKKRLVVDHDHTTGEVRGLLCHNCNVGLGNFKDEIKILKSAITYLLKSRGSDD